MEKLQSQLCFVRRVFPLNLLGNYLLILVKLYLLPVKNSNVGWVSLSNICRRNVPFIASLIFFPLLCCLTLQARETLGVIVDITDYSSDETELKLGGERVNGKL